MHALYNTLFWSMYVLYGNRIHKLESIWALCFEPEFRSIQRTKSYDAAAIVGTWTID